MAGGGGATVNVEPISKEAASCWGVEAVKESTNANSGVRNAYAAILGIIGTVGLFRQWDALDRSLDIAQEQVDVAERYVDLAERNYDEVTLRAYQCQKDLFTRYVDTFAACEEVYIEDAKAERMYEADYALYEGRAVAGVGVQFSRLKQARKRQRDKYATGLCCHEDLQLQIAKAQSVAEAANRGYRYEDQRKIQLDQWLWQRFSQAIDVIGSMRAHVISGVNGGVAGANSGINAITGLVSQRGAAAAETRAAVQDQASFWGSISNGAFGLAGAMLGWNATGATSQFNLPFMGAGSGVSSPTTSSFIGATSGGSTAYSGGKLATTGTSVSDPTVVLGGPNIGYSASSGYYGG